MQSFHNLKRKAAAQSGVLSTHTNQTLSQLHLPLGIRTYEKFTNVQTRNKKQENLRGLHYLKVKYFMVFETDVPAGELTALFISGWGTPWQVNL